MYKRIIHFSFEAIIRWIYKSKIDVYPRFGNVIKNYDWIEWKSLMELCLILIARECRVRKSIYFLIFKINSALNTM